MQTAVLLVIAACAGMMGHCAAFADEPLALGDQGRRVFAAIHAEMGVDASVVPVHVVTASELEERFRGTGGQLRFRFELYGFEHKGHVYVRKILGVVKTSTLVHELLHALSLRFNDAAQKRRHWKIIEGTTEYFTWIILRDQFHLSTKELDRAYADDRSFVEALAERVGRDRITAAYLQGGFGNLERIVDRQYGRGAFEKACGSLDQGRLGDALAAIGWKARTLR